MFHNPACACLQNVISNKCKDRHPMKKLSLTLILFVFMAGLSVGQKNQPDTLFIAGKTFLLEKSGKNLPAPKSYQFQNAVSQYKGYNRKDFSYFAVDTQNVRGQEYFYQNLHSIVVYKRNDKKLKSYHLTNFTDTLSINASDAKQSEIYIKQGSSKILIDLIVFKLIADSSIVLSIPNLNPNDDPYFVRLAEAVESTKPSLIILDEMFYENKEHKMYYVPRQFVLKLKSK